MLDITEIIAGVWIGSYPGKALPEKIKVIISLAIEYRPSAYHDELRGLLWMPIIDGIRPNLEWLDTIVNYICQVYDAKQELLVHCMAGISRSALVVCAFLMKQNGYDYREALAFVKERRPIVNLAPVYVELLHDYAEFLKTKGK